MFQIPWEPHSQVQWPFSMTSYIHQYWWWTLLFHRASDTGHSFSILVLLMSAFSVDHKYLLLLVRIFLHNSFYLEKTGVLFIVRGYTICNYMQPMRVWLYTIPCTQFLQRREPSFTWNDICFYFIECFLFNISALHFQVSCHDACNQHYILQWNIISNAKIIRKLIEDLAYLALEHVTCLHCSEW